MSRNNIWMSVSDMMTGLMVIFMFISIAYMMKVSQHQTIIQDFVDYRTKIYDRLVTKLSGNMEKWDMSIGKDLKIRFDNPEVLFESGSYQLTPKFREILDEFIPQYLDILLNDSISNNIEEIRIEGHTDDKPIPSLGPDPFLANARLSQLRSYSVLEYIRNMAAFRSKSKEQRDTLDFWLTANGLSYGKAIDEDGVYTIVSGKKINRDKSRRVEFRIVTTDIEVMETFVNSIN